MWKRSIIGRWGCYWWSVTSFKMWFTGLGYVLSKCTCILEIRYGAIICRIDQPQYDGIFLNQTQIQFHLFSTISKKGKASLSGRQGRSDRQPTAWWNHKARLGSELSQAGYAFFWRCERYLPRNQLWSCSWVAALGISIDRWCWQWVHRQSKRINAWTNAILPKASITFQEAGLHILTLPACLF